MPGDEPEGLRMSLDALIQKRGGGSSGRGSHKQADRGRGRGSFPTVRGGVSKPEAGGRGARDRNTTDAKAAPGRGVGSGSLSSRGGFSGGRGGGRFGGSQVDRAGAGGGRGWGRGAAPQQQPQPLPKQMQQQQQFLHMQPPFMGPTNAAEMAMRLAESQRIIVEQQRQTIMLQQQLLQQQALAQAAAHHAVRSLPDALPTPAMPSTRKPPLQIHSLSQEPEPKEDLMPNPALDKLVCQLDEDTGNVVIYMEDITIVTATPMGELILSTGGWYEDATVDALNATLKPLGMRIIVHGDVDLGNWSISDGRKLAKFKEENGVMTIGAYGNNAATRAQDLLQYFQSPPATQKAFGTRTAASAAAARPTGTFQGMHGRPGAAQVQMEVDANLARRMKAQGRY